MVLVPPGSQLIGCVGFVEALDAANRFLAFRGKEALYDVEMVGIAPSTPTATGTVLSLPAADPSASLHTFVVGGGLDDGVRPVDPRVLDVADALAARAERVVSVCMGAFTLGALGRLDGRPCTTHWLGLDALRSRFPAAEVAPDAIYTEDRELFTSAGASAGIDLALHLIARDGGSRLAVAVARGLVVFAHRPGGQSQFGSAVRVRHDVDRRLRGLIDDVRARPGDDHRVEVLASRVGMSARNFARVFRDQVGSTPAAFVTQVRVEAAQRALQLGDASMDALAGELGFGTPATFRRAFVRVTGVTPRAWRARFAVSL